MLSDHQAADTFDKFFIICAFDNYKDYWCLCFENNMPLVLYERSSLKITGYVFK